MEKKQEKILFLREKYTCIFKLDRFNHLLVQSRYIM